ncbi:MAG: BolA family protein [Xanthomonadales bacterium]|nr:BolA family protein [Xanthomonadales bacterium]
MNTRRVDRIRLLLESAFEPESLEVEDDSQKHAGHEGAKSGLGHFNVSIISSHFNGMKMLARHRAVYAALDEMMKTDIHALAIEAIASDEI